MSAGAVLAGDILSLAVAAAVLWPRAVTGTSADVYTVCSTRRPAAPFRPGAVHGRALHVAGALLDGGTFTARPAVYGGWGVAGSMAGLHATATGDVTV